LIKYILKRVLYLIPVLLGVTFIVFTMMYFTPGDPARILLGESAPQEDVDKLREEMGIDRPYIEQFTSYVWGVFTRFDFGTSYVSRTPVIKDLLARFPTTALVGLLSVILAVLIGVPAGIISAIKQYSVFDHGATVIALLGVSMPNFWQGLMSVLIFSVWLHWLPASGFYGPEYWVLPVLTIGTSTAAIIMRMTRSSMLEVIRQDYIRTARAKGQTEYKVVMRHALKNALIPIITVIGLQIGYLLGGSLLAETVFSIPGIGKLLVDSIKRRDYPMVQAGVLFIAFTFSIVNLMVDILYAFTDPRIKSQYRSKKKGES